MTFHSRRLPGLFVALLAAACGKNATSSIPTADEACGDYAAARCAKFAACEAVAIAKRYGDEATCLSREKTGCLSSLAAPSTGASPESVANCVTAFASYSCADFYNDNPPAACQPQVGQRAAGQACAFNAQCQSAFCAIPKGSACGTCGNRLAAGDSCATVTPCGFNLVCSTLTEQCTAWGIAGSSCARGDNTCGFGLGCVGATATTPGACQPLAAEGAGCGGPNAATPAVCDNRAGLYCNSANVCTVATPAAPGEACGRLADDGGTVTRDYCTGASACLTPDAGVPGTCTGPAADGQACDTSTDLGCTAPARCVGTASEAGVTGVCQLPTATGC